MKSPGEYLAFCIDPKFLHPAQSDDKVEVPWINKVGFEGNPFDGRSLRLLDFMWGKNVGLPESIYFAQIVGSSVKPDGWYFEYTVGFERSKLKSKDEKCDRKDSIGPKPEELHRPKFSSAPGSLVALQEIADYCELFEVGAPFWHSRITMFRRWLSNRSKSGRPTNACTLSSADGESSHASASNSVFAADPIDEISAPIVGSPIDIGEGLLVPVDDEPIFSTCASDMNSGEKLAMALRILPEDHKAIADKIREYLDDTRYQIGGGAFVVSNRTHFAEMLFILLMLGGLRMLLGRINVRGFSAVVKCKV